MNSTDSTSCAYKEGPLPACAPLALGYTPIQQASTPAYDAEEALTRGTLFPGLDLPFMNIVNKNAPRTPLTELMALDFVCKEFGLYLDTHKDDAEAFAMFQSMLKLAEEGRKRYTALYGPISKTDLINAKSYTWLSNPWPWEYCKAAEGEK